MNHWNWAYKMSLEISHTNLQDPLEAFHVNNKNVTVLLFFQVMATSDILTVVQICISGNYAQKWIIKFHIYHISCQLYLKERRYRKFLSQFVVTDSVKTDITYIQHFLSVSLKFINMRLHSCCVKAFSRQLLTFT